MDESSQNEDIMNNNDKIYLNDVIMKQEFEIQLSINRKKFNANEREERTKENLKKLHIQKKVET
jgi:hypothetical protein